LGIGTNNASIPSDLKKSHSGSYLQIGWSFAGCKLKTRQFYLSGLKANHLQENWCLQFVGTHKARNWNITEKGAQQKTGIINSEMLTDRLKPAIRSKCWELLSKGVNVVAWQCLTTYC
jgi:hypothetical protein